MSRSDWISVDPVGLAKLQEARGYRFLIDEMLQNGWDEAVNGATQIAVTLMKDLGSPYATLVAIDNGPGFKNLKDGCTLFAPSYKQDNPDQAGRFNAGCKFVLAMAGEACLSTTSGTIDFDATGRNIRKRKKRDQGTSFSFNIRMSSTNIQEILDSIKKAPYFAPSKMETMIKIGDQQIFVRGQNDHGFKTFQCTLPTQIAGDDRVMRPTKRKTEVRLYHVHEGETAHVYERGIPIAETDMPFHVVVMQKVPLGKDRDALTESFRKKLQVEVLNNSQEFLTSAEAKKGWATEALEHADLDGDAAEDVMTKRYGAKRVAWDPSDPEANNIAMSKGYTVVPGGSLSKAAWSNVKTSGAIRPAGQVTPSPKPYSEDGTPLNLIPEEDWTPAMQQVAQLTRRCCYIAWAFKCDVQFAAEPKWPFSATYGPGGPLVFNASKIKKILDDVQGQQERLFDLIIHELGHEKSGNHLNEEYHRALTLIGARLVLAATVDPNWIEKALDIKEQA